VRLVFFVEELQPKFFDLASCKELCITRHVWVQGWRGGV
jgi:hypothetical protein